MRPIFKIAFSFFCLAGATGCSLDEPTWVNPARVEVHGEGFKDSFDTASLDAKTLRAIGVNYYRYGNGPMNIVVTYDPQSKTNNAQSADREAKRIAGEIGRYGAKDINFKTAAVTSSGDRSQTIVSFPALTARPPESCGLMPGFADAQTAVPKNAEGQPPSYQMGCTIEAMMAKQVARPGDLLGRPGFETDADGRRQEAVVWQRGYYAATSNPPLQGANASQGSSGGS